MIFFLGQNPILEQILSYNKLKIDLLPFLKIELTLYFLLIFFLEFFLILYYGIITLGS